MSTKPTPSTVAFVYARASVDRDDTKISVDRQLKLSAARANELWPAAEVRTFRDDGITAADPDVHRPGYAAFLDAVRTARKGSILGIVVSEQSRLTRQPGQWNELVVALHRAGVAKIETLRSGSISVEEGNQLVGGILALVDADEVQRVRARVRIAHRELYKDGRPSGRAPFGYRSAKDDTGRSTYVIHDDEAAVVRLVFDMVLAGHALASIVDRLNADGVPPRSARFKFKDGRTAAVTAWSPSSVKTLITSPSVAGLRAHTDADGITSTTPAIWPKLIDVDLWHQAQRILSQPTTVTGRDGTRFVVRAKPAPKPRSYLLSGGRLRGGGVHGVLRCGKCDSPLIAQTQSRRNGARVAAYACHPKLGPDACGGCSISPADQVEDLVVDAIKTRLAASPELRAKLAASDDSDAGRWRDERDAAKARMLNAATMLGSGEIDHDVFRAMHDPARAAHEAAEERLASLAHDLALPSAEDVAERWEALTLAQQRAVVGALVDRVVIGPGRGGRPGLDPTRVGTPVWKA